MQADGFSYITIFSHVPSFDLACFLTFCIVIIIDEAIDFEDAFIHDSEISSFKNQCVMVKLSFK